MYDKKTLYILNLFIILVYDIGFMIRILLNKLKKK